MEEIIHVPEEQSETGNLTEYTESVVECFDSVPEVAKPLIGSAGRLLNRIEKMLFFGSCCPTSTGQKRRFPVRSCRYSVVLVVPKKTQQRGSSLTCRP